MVPEPREPAIENIINLSWGAHACYFYETKQDLLDTLALCFKAGLEANEFCLWVISQSLTREEATDALRKVVPNLDRYVANRSIEIHSYDEWYREEGNFDLNKVRSGFDEKLNDALVRGYAGLRLTGDVSWMSEHEWKRFQEYEKGLSDVVANQRMMILCTYPLATTSAGEVFDVARAHQFAIAKRRGIWEIVETPELKQAKAEIKRLNDELEQRVAERTRELAATNEELKDQIAERLRVADELREQQAILQQIFDHSPVLIRMLDKDGRIKVANRAWEHTVGWTLDEIQGNEVDIYAALYPDAEERQRDLNQVAEANGQWADFQIKVRDGQEIDLAVAWFSLPTAPGSASGRMSPSASESNESSANMKKPLKA